jgi:hypothetical protein
VGQEVARTQEAAPTQEAAVDSQEVVDIRARREAARSTAVGNLDSIYGPTGPLDVILAGKGMGRRCST